MSKVDIAEVSMGRCPQSMPYVIMFEIFRNLPKDKLIEVSRLSPKFKDIAGDTRLWKDVHIKYEPNRFDFEELYSEPWPVALIDLSQSQINPPVSLQTDRVVKVAELNLSFIKANNVTVDAIFTKYQCTKLLLNFRAFGFPYRTLEVPPEAFSKQTALEVLSIRAPVFVDERGLWLTQVLNNCKNLKTLDLSKDNVGSLDMSSFVKILPRSLEKLLIATVRSKNPFLESLAERIPNLKELGYCHLPKVKCLSLLEFKFLEALHVIPRGDQEVDDLLMCLTKFPALKTVYILSQFATGSEITKFEMLLTRLKQEFTPQGITVLDEIPERPWPVKPVEYPADGNFWHVSKAV